MTAVFFYVLVAMEDGKNLKKGQEIVSSNSYFSEQSCADAARLIAQAMLVKENTKYGFRCVKVDYDPPNLTPK